MFKFLIAIYLLTQTGLSASTLVLEQSLEQKQEASFLDTAFNSWPQWSSKLSNIAVLEQSQFQEQKISPLEIALIFTYQKFKKKVLDIAKKISQYPIFEISKQIVPIYRPNPNKIFDDNLNLEDKKEKLQKEIDDASKLIDAYQSGAANPSQKDLNDAHKKVAEGKHQDLSPQGEEIQDQQESAPSIGAPYIPGIISLMMSGSSASAAAAASGGSCASNSNEPSEEVLEPKRLPKLIPPYICSTGGILHQAMQYASIPHSAWRPHPAWMPHPRIKDLEILQNNLVCSAVAGIARARAPRFLEEQGLDAHGGMIWMPSMPSMLLVRKIKLIELSPALQGFLEKMAEIDSGLRELSIILLPNHTEKEVKELVNVLKKSTLLKTLRIVIREGANCGTLQPLAELSQLRELLIELERYYAGEKISGEFKIDNFLEKLKSSQSKLRILNLGGTFKISGKIDFNELPEKLEEIITPRLDGQITGLDELKLKYYAKGELFPFETMYSDLAKIRYLLGNGFICEQLGEKKCLELISEFIRLYSSALYVQGFFGDTVLMETIKASSLFDIELLEKLLLPIIKKSTPEQLNIQNSLGQTLGMLIAKHIGSQNPLIAKGLLSLIIEKSIAAQLNIQNSLGQTLGMLIAQHIGPIESQVVKELLLPIIEKSIEAQLNIQDGSGRTLGMLIAEHIERDEPQIAKELLSLIIEKSIAAQLNIQDGFGKTLGMFIATHIGSKNPLIAQELLLPIIEKSTPEQLNIQNWYGATLGMLIARDIGCPQIAKELLLKIAEKIKENDQGNQAIFRDMIKQYIQPRNPGLARELETCLKDPNANRRDRD